MHQHPRSPAPAAPPSSARPRSQDQDRRSDSPASDFRTHLNRGLGLETENDSADSAQNMQPGKEAIAKLSQIISNYHTKAALIVLHSRVELPPLFFKGSDTPRVNRWFNVEIEETDLLREQLKTWRFCDVTDNRPPPLIIETFLDTTGLTNNQSLVALDENGKRWDVLESLTASQSAQSVKPASSRADDVILERWRVELGDMPGKLPADLGTILPTIYKKSIVLFRSLFTYAKFLPAWKFIKRNGRFRANPALRIKYRILSEQSTKDLSKPDHLTIPLYEGNTKVVDTYSFGITESPAGPFSVQVTYRTNCDFRVDDSEALLSSQFMGADDEIFQPSLPSRGVYTKATNMEVGSAPLERKSAEGPDPSQAYGSLSTFHHVAPTGASPIATLRAVRDSGALSPSPPTSSHRKTLTSARASPAGRAAILASEGNPNVARRPSISFQPFKAPPLSASPSLVDPPLGVSPRTTPARTSLSESINMPPPSMAASTRKPLSSATDNALESSNSASPRPASISRYSSAFSHRRGRPSSGNINRVEDDNSSGRASATSSGAQPGSGLLAELTGTSADSIHADDENISEFLKMLDLRKDLLKPSNHTPTDSLARRTTATSAALTRFQRMRDSNAALSDSMSSSLFLHRSSNTSSKQLSGVPPMIAGASISTASSPGGKAISPHTPHTPAIPSRLSSNSIIDHDTGTTARALSRRNNGSPLEEDTSDETTVEGHPSTVTAIPIPTSPASLFPSTFRRSSSAANRRSSTAVDDDEIFTMRSVSLGAEEPSHTSLRTLQRQHEYETAGTNIAPSESESRTRGDDATVLRSPATQESGPHRGASALGPTAEASPSSNRPLHQRRFSHSRGRGFSGGPHSLSSGSSSVARGGIIPPYLAERDPERDGNASGSNSATEDRRTGLQFNAGRHNLPQPTQLEEDEPLLFAMSDFGVSRRSFEEGRQGNHDNTNGSRRGSGRRGGLSSFHVWP
ncbi:autophagy-related protein 13-domain-containing protein [Aspergillus cavernicola]|uniref:Autophagy-related protein 13 n=1 Tax=Aspergillus cavernicola TaxID=176166 RepID=A0ABR4IPW6_9EURO